MTAIMMRLTVEATSSSALSIGLGSTYSIELVRGLAFFYLVINVDRGVLRHKLGTTPFTTLFCLQLQLSQLFLFFSSHLLKSLKFFFCPLNLCFAIHLDSFFKFSLSLSLLSDSLLLFLNQFLTLLLSLRYFLLSSFTRQQLHHLLFFCFIHDIEQSLPFVFTVLMPSLLFLHSVVFFQSLSLFLLLSQTLLF